MALAATPCLAEPAMTAPPLTVTTSIAFPLNTVVGPVRAGLLCMPNGKLRGRDFLRSQRDFSLLIQRALSERQADPSLARLGDLQVDLQRMRVKLCARSWGVFGTGDRKALSGQAEFTFAWSSNRDSAATKSIARIIIERNKDDAIPTEEIMEQALNRLLDQIAQSSL
ncbi:hypothetical protein [Sphingobium sp. WCS2017Hpa-17]|uniref:hypothetical protein n=1 Tax=Sphingobium sp. WCS2017Hpa-17 TaxID=3073638 RepID=UPI00288A9BA0|nr:hypothetical protein [Sphingobium sp. WCS2017Hpa-17]